jgi:hypothetical protein
VAIVVLTLVMIGLLSLFATRVRNRVASPAESNVEAGAPEVVRQKGEIT